MCICLSNSSYIIFFSKVTSDLQETKSRVRDKIAEGEHESEAKSGGSGSHRSRPSTSDEKRTAPIPRIEDPKKKKSTSAPKHPPPPSFADLVSCRVSKLKTDSQEFEMGSAFSDVMYLNLTDPRTNKNNFRFNKKNTVQITSQLYLAF